MSKVNQNTSKVLFQKFWLLLQTNLRQTKCILPRNAILVANSYHALFRLSVHKNPAEYISGAKHLCICTIHDFCSLTIYALPFHWRIKTIILIPQKEQRTDRFTLSNTTTNALFATVVPTKSDSDVIFCFKLLSKTLNCTLQLS